MTDRFRDPDFPRLFSLERLGFGYSRAAQVFRPNRTGEALILDTRPPVIGVYVDGACPGNGKPWAKGGYGVYFGPNSSFNVSNPLKESSRQTSQRAELTAALVALNQIERIAKINLNQGVNSNLFVILTDSAYLVNSLTSYIYKWRQNDYTSASGREVANRDLFERLDSKLDAMAYGRQGIDVLFCKVDRGENENADSLARDGAEM